ncbi:MAG: hypothetical protein HQL37_15785, partial [Alphaproteobacteria bacterium]|nr:hypothetical protein [Alphaproteobacteria bacterium]
APWTGTADQLREMIPPDESEIASVLTCLANEEGTLKETRRNHQDALDKKSAMELNRDHLTRDNNAVSLEQINEARGNRDALWHELRGHLRNEHPLPAPSEAATEFEHRSGVADGVADRRYDAAELSAQLTTVLKDLERNALDITIQARVLAEAQTAVQTITDAWRARLAPLNLQMEPRAFSSWLERRRHALEAAGEVSLAQAAVDEAERQRDTARMRLAQALEIAALEVAEIPLPAIGTLLETAERLEADALETAHQRRSLGSSIATASDALKRAEARQREARQKVAAWENRWTDMVHTVHLCATHSHAVIRDQLDILDKLRGEVDEILEMESRISKMEADVAAFNTHVIALANTCNFETRDRTPADLFTQITTAEREAVKTQARKEGLTERINAAERRLAKANKDSARALARLRPLFEAAGILDAGSGDRVELAAVIRRSDLARTLRQTLDKHITEILTAGTGPTLDVLMAESEHAEGAALAVRANELQDAASRLSAEIETLTSDRATTEAEFAQLQAGPDAAIAAADAELAKAAMASHAEAYVRKRAEVVLLRWMIARYRAEKQTPLLKRASILFSQLTLGRYTELLVNPDADEKERLSGLAQDQSVVPFAGMSEGTADQLFLALRLAAVEDAVAAGARLPFIADDLFIN